MKFLFKTFALAAASFLLLCGLAFGVLQMRVAKEKISSLATSFAKEKGLELSIEAISGSFPFRFILQQVAIQRGNGENVYLKGVSIRVNFFDLLRGEIRGK